VQQKQPPKSVVRDREESRDPATTAGFFFLGCWRERGRRRDPSKSWSIPVAEPLLLRFSSSPYFRASLKTVSHNFSVENGHAVF